MRRDAQLSLRFLLSARSNGEEDVLRTWVRAASVLLSEDLAAQEHF